MQLQFSHRVKESKLFRKKLLQWSLQYDNVCCLDNHAYTNNKYNSYDFIVALGGKDVLKISENTDLPFDELKEFYETEKDWLFGFLSYDLKNCTEQLRSENYDGIQMPLMHFFRPEILFMIKDDLVEVKSTIHDKEKVYNIVKEIGDSSIVEEQVVALPPVNNRISKEEYLLAVQNVIDHIQLGDIYEANFCQEFYHKNVTVSPLQLYFRLSEISPAPFGCFYKEKDKFLISASPERFLKKVGSKIISQPIKGTSRRGDSKEEDEALKQQLFESAKDRKENVMIVDLMRNDLSKTAKEASVNVEELYCIYSFPQVHQMISTVTSEMDPCFHFTEVIKEAFPMGSMTGAPKVRAMELIEQYESTRRGLFSGAVGYIDPQGDFDFNVIIRSMLYNESNKYLSFITGGAITSSSTPENEYEESLLKAKALMQVLRQNVNAD